MFNGTFRVSSARAWVAYTVLSAALVAAAGAVVTLWVGTPARHGAWSGLGTAWIVQAAAFGLLVATREPAGKRMIVGWVGGTVLRLLTLIAVGLLALTGRWPFPAEATLLALAAGLFVLLLLEPFVVSRRWARS